MTWRAASSPAPVAWASPMSQPPSSRHSASSSGPAARWIAPSPPPPPSRLEFAALTIASTFCSVMSPRTTSITGHMLDLRPSRNSHVVPSGSWFADAVFYLCYLRSELLRQRWRTIVTLLGLGLGVALVIAIASLSKGLDRAQKKTLDPLGGIGTDLTVTLSPQQSQGGFGVGRGAAT